MFIFTDSSCHPTYTHTRASIYLNKINAGRLAWLGLFTIRNLKFLILTRAGAPGWVLTDLLWLLAVISDLWQYIYSWGFDQSEERIGGQGTMYWRIWLQVGRDLKEGGGNRFVHTIFWGEHEEFNYISESVRQFSIHSSGYYTILCVSVAGSVDVYSSVWRMAGSLVKFKKKR